MAHDEPCVRINHDRAGDPALTIGCWGMSATQSWAGPVGRNEWATRSFENTTVSDFARRHLLPLKACSGHQAGDTLAVDRPPELKPQLRGDPRHAVGPP